MNAPVITETLDRILYDKYEADSLGTVAERVHDRLVQLGWNLPPGQFWVSRTGSTFALEYMLTRPSRLIQAHRMCGDCDDCDPNDLTPVALRLPMLMQPHELGTFAGFLITNEFWLLRDVSPEDTAHRAHPIWQGHMDAHPDREDARQTGWAEPSGRVGAVQSRATGAKVPLEMDESIMPCPEELRDLGALARSVQDCINTGREFLCTRWLRPGGDD